MKLVEIDAATVIANLEIKALKKKLDDEYCKAVTGSREALLAIREEYLAAYYARKFAK